jgi:hypothetical protein
MCSGWRFVLRLHRGPAAAIRSHPMATGRNRQRLPRQRSNRLDQARVIVLTLPTRWLTGPAVISSGGYGPSIRFSPAASAVYSRSQPGEVSGFRITGIRLWISPHSSFGFVVMIAKLRTHSPLASASSPTVRPAPSVPGRLERSHRVVFRRRSWPTHKSCRPAPSSDAAGMLRESGVAIPLMFANPTLMSFAQYGTQAPTEDRRGCARGP